MGKQLKTKDKEKILKAARAQKDTTDTEQYSKVNDISSETMEARKQWNTPIHVPNDKNYQSGNPTCSENNVQSRRQNKDICKIFKNLKEFSARKPTL